MIAIFNPSKVFEQLFALILTSNDLEKHEHETVLFLKLVLFQVLHRELQPVPLPIRAPVRLLFVL